jgi:hypothetical protein
MLNNEKNNHTKYEIKIDEYFSGIDYDLLEMENPESQIYNAYDSPIHNEAYYLTSQNHPLEEEYGDLGDMFYPDAPNYNENLSGQCMDIEYLLRNDPYYDIPEEVLTEDEFYLEAEEEYEIPEYLDREWLLSEYKFIEEERLGLESMLANDPYYDDLNYELEDVVYITDDQLYEDYIEDKIEYLLDDNFDDEPYFDDDEFYYEFMPQKHPLEEYYDDLGDAYYPDAPNYKENINGQYFDW